MEPQAIPGVAPIPVMVDPLAEIQLSVEMHQSRAAALESELAQLDAALSDIAALSSDLKVRASEFDVEAGNQLDKLEREAVATMRRREGLVTRIATARAELRPIEERASQLAGQQDARRQDEVVKAAYARKDELIAAILSHWSEACEAAYSLMELVSGSSELKGRVVELEGQRLDEEHKRQLASIVTSVGERLMAARAEHANQAASFDFAYSTVFRHLEIVPARRRKEARRVG